MQSTATAPAGLVDLVVAECRKLTEFCKEPADKSGFIEVSHGHLLDIDSYAKDCLASIECGDIAAAKASAEHIRSTFAYLGVTSRAKGTLPAQLSARLAWAAAGFLKFHSDYYRAALRRVLAEVKLFRDLTEWERGMA